MLSNNASSTTLEGTEPKPGGGPTCLTGRLTGFFFEPGGMTDDGLMLRPSTNDPEGIMESNLDSTLACGFIIG